MKPAIVEQGTHLSVSLQNVGNRLARRLDAHCQPQGLVSILLAIVDGLLSEAAPKGATVPLQDTPMPPVTLCRSLLPQPNSSGATVEP